MEKLLDAARQTISKAYAPYSAFKVGAAVRGASGRIYTGANIENASYGLTICAERVAIFKAVSEGERKLNGVALAAASGEIIFPCGACLQVMAEFGAAEIIMGDDKGNYKIYSLKELFPYSFTLNINKEAGHG